MEAVLEAFNSILFGGLGGFAVYSFATLWSHPRGDLSDHEERLRLVENLVRTVNKDLKSRRMRELRSAEGSEQPTGSNPAPAGFPQPQFETKEQLRARIASQRLRPEGSK